MKTLFLMRHGKANMPSSTQGDYDRDLAERGLIDTARVGKFIFDQQFHIDLTLASSATRAKQTAALVVKNASLNNLIENKDLYLASMEEHTDLLSKQDNSINNILIVTHNPGISHLLFWLIGMDAQEFKTSSLAHIQLPISSWSEIKKMHEKGQLAGFWHPNDLG